MKKIIFAAVAAAFSFSAFAGQSEYVSFDNVKSTKTRAEVVAEIKNSPLKSPTFEFEYPVLKVETNKTRAQVIAEMEAAKKTGWDKIYRDGQ